MIFYPGVLLLTNGVRMGRQAVGPAGGRLEKICLGCISETVRCRKLMLGRDIGRGCRCTASLCDLDLTLL